MKCFDSLEVTYLIYFAEYFFEDFLFFPFFGNKFSCLVIPVLLIFKGVQMTAVMF